LLKEVKNMRAAVEAVAEMFRGFKPSKQAKEIVGKALDNGVDPSYHVDRAVEEAKKKGKRKVCVKPRSPLCELKEQVLRKITRG
jgi:hypothetical protein